jgi:hypothetical protein
MRDQRRPDALELAVDLAHDLLTKLPTMLATDTFQVAPTYIAALGFLTELVLAGGEHFVAALALQHDVVARHVCADVALQV